MAKKKFFSPTCHPERPYYAKDLCRQCYGNMCYRDRYGEKIRARTNRGHLLRDLRRFGMTLIDFNVMVTAQGNHCGICGESPKPGRRLDLDHDDTTMTARGLLCNSCNQGLGLFKDNADLLIQAAEYLGKPRG